MSDIILDKPVILPRLFSLSLGEYSMSMDVDNFRPKVQSVSNSVICRNDKCAESKSDKLTNSSLPNSISNCGDAPREAPDLYLLQQKIKFQAAIIKNLMLNSIPRDGEYYRLLTQNFKNDQVEIISEAFFRVYPRHQNIILALVCQLAYKNDTVKNWVLQGLQEQSHDLGRLLLPDPELFELVLGEGGRFVDLCPYPGLLENYPYTMLPLEDWKFSLRHTDQEKRPGALLAFLKDYASFQERIASEENVKNQLAEAEEVVRPEYPRLT